MKEETNGEPKILGPNKKIGYFPSRKDKQAKQFPNAVTIESCERDFNRLAGRFSKRAIGLLRRTLKKGELNGCFYETDLFGTIAKALDEKPDELCKRIGHTQSLENPAEYWFFQIGPKIMGGQKTYDQCIFTETAIHWCDKLLKRKKRPKSMVQRQRKPRRKKNVGRQHANTQPEDYSSGSSFQN